MQSKKNRYMTGDRIQGEFDSFIKKSIYIIARDVIRDNMRAKNRLYEVRLQEDEYVPAPEYVPESEKIPVHIGNTVVMFCDEKKAEGFNLLKRRHREIIEKAFIFDMPTAAIAELMDLEEKSVKNYLSEAKGILKKYM